MYAALRLGCIRTSGFAAALLAAAAFARPDAQIRSLTGVIDEAKPFVTRGLRGPVGITVNKQTGDIYVANRSGNFIAKVASGGTIASFAEAPDDAAYIAAALGDVARARGMTNLAKRTGLTRMGLYKALSKDGNPSFDTVLKVLHALGLRLTATPA